MPQPEPGSPLDSGDARTLQHVYSGGVLWFSAQTAAHVGSPDAPLSVAVVYFALLPAWNETAVVEEEGGATGNLAGNSVLLSSLKNSKLSIPGALSNRHSAAFSPRLVAAGYFAAPNGASLSRPAITAEPDGTAWVSALLTGPSTFPTQVAARADLLEGPLSLHASVLSPVILGPTVPDKKFRGSASSGNVVNGAGNKTGSLRAGEWFRRSFQFFGKRERERGARRRRRKLIPPPHKKKRRRLRRRHARRAGQRLARRDVVRRRALGLVRGQVHRREMPLLGHAREQNQGEDGRGGGSRSESFGQSRFARSQRGRDLCQGRRGPLCTRCQGRGVGGEGGQGETSDGGEGEGREGGEEGKHGGDRGGPFALGRCSFFCFCSHGSSPCPERSHLRSR